MFDQSGAGPTHSAYIMTESLVIFQVLSEALCVEGYSAQRIADLQFLRSTSTNDNPALLFVDIDCFGGLEVIVSFLIDFRFRCPEVCVILTSAEFSRSDFELHRLPLADVSLRIPLSQAEVSLALIVAPYNNAQWYRRIMEQEEVTAEIATTRNV